LLEELHAADQLEWERAIADAIQKLRDEPERAAEMGREARERAKRFTWENALKEVRQGLERVTS
jgi:glycosyltransferase involved in cell wall biosynthesis